MKRLTLAMLLGIIMTSTSLQAQVAVASTKTIKPDETKLETTNKGIQINKEPGVVYINDQNRTYVNKNLPIYLKFSTEPDGEVYDLKSLKHPEDAEPLYLDTEGANYIRTKWAIDPATKEYALPMREVQMELFADSEAPLVRAVFESSSQFREGGIQYYGNDLSITLDDWDAQAGVKSSYWSINENSWKEGKAEFAGSGSGPYSFSYYSVDNVNNYSEQKESMFVFDETAPATDLLRTDLGTFVFGPKTYMQFKIEEEHSGLNATYYKIGNEEFKKVGKNELIPRKIADGEHNLRYYSVDNVSNQEAINERSIYYDKTPPTTTLSATNSSRDADLLYLSASSEIGLSADDNKAGVRETTYSVLKQSNSTYSEKFFVKDFHGSSVIMYSSIDLVDNLESLNVQQIFVDTLRPKTQIEFLGEYYEVANRFYINESTSIKLSGTDAHAGLNYTEYAYVGSDYTAYGNPFKLKEEGYNGLMYRSVDKVNNTEFSNSIELYLDSKGPEVVHNFSNRPLSEENGTKVYPVGTRLFLGATDDQSGTNTISYQINNQKEVHYSSPRTIDISEKKAFKKGKTYEVKITSTDLVNNATEKTVTFKIESSE